MIVYHVNNCICLRVFSTEKNGWTNFNTKISHIKMIEWKKITFLVQRYYDKLDMFVLSFLQDNPGLRTVHGLLGSSIMTLFLIHAALGLQLGLSFWPLCHNYWFILAPLQCESAKTWGGSLFHYSCSLHDGESFQNQCWIIFHIFGAVWSYSIIQLYISLVSIQRIQYDFKK